MKKMTVFVKWFAESLLFLVALPILAFQSIEMIQALFEMLAEMAEWDRFHK
ncbi:MAG TPA: hypothetical protein VFJ73_00645 [Bacillales bacterium]|nr:hypothetical protein [Bacillales bacterium]